MNYLVEQNKLVEPLYEMEKNGQLTGEGDKGMEGLPFLNGQIVKGGQMLGNLWLTAWLTRRKTLISNASCNSGGDSN